MHLFLLTALTMCAFAANSILNRLAVESGASDPASFAVVRVLCGALVLCALVVPRGGTLRVFDRRRVIGAGSLSLYMVGFSVAYLSLDAGLGALILFAVVQISMFLAGTLTGAIPTFRQVAGAAIAMAGLAWVLWPGAEVRVDPTGAALMVAAGVGWAAYSIAGRSEPDALAGTASNFVVALPVTAGILVAGAPAWHLTWAGLGLAAVSGGMTSGLGYALWYRLLPQLAPAVAAVVQLSVPVIAIIAGVALLGEQLSLRLMAGAGLVLGGIALAVVRVRRR
ncbi:DMT family transporter [Ruegeria arenilitoris]|uniref:Putative DMT superfamily transporter inner membrane protein n=1 Tax=Ruegeria arenilitoris TaxID=1173585 RepID=A0A238KZR8_9RHOB|nr:DMT family transporter [Ruegeria arenilitoris]SMX47702.1 putative DMT superfamily transporter inner membrane protein [Ruegeria arenilitoris]